MRVSPFNPSDVLRCCVCSKHFPVIQPQGVAVISAKGRDDNVIRAHFFACVDCSPGQGKAVDIKALFPVVKELYLTLEKEVLDE